MIYIKKYVTCVLNINISTIIYFRFSLKFIFKLSLIFLCTEKLFIYKNKIYMYFNVNIVLNKYKNIICIKL
jgi:hypothetical protein